MRWWLRRSGDFVVGCFFGCIIIFLAYVVVVVRIVQLCVYPLLTPAECVAPGYWC